jgi:uncharacterized protein (DUF2249 family)
MVNRTSERAAQTPHEELPPPPAGIAADAVVELDVRDDLRNRREPFSRIMAAVEQVPPGGALALRAIFEPVPLYGVLAQRGFTSHTEQLGAADWLIWFQRTGSAAPQAEAGPVPAAAAPTAAGVVELDVRGFEPPEPMVRTLAALEAMACGGTLVQINSRVPEHLLPQLTARGYTYVVDEADDAVRVTIRRAP